MRLLPLVITVLFCQNLYAQDLFTYNGSISELLLNSSNQDDTVKVYYNDGQLRLMCLPESNGQSGCLKEFYKSGQLKSSHTYQGTGLFYVVNYHVNGNRLSEGVIDYPIMRYSGIDFYSGPTTAKRGKWLYYNKKGKVIKSQVFDEIASAY